MKTSNIPNVKIIEKEHEFIVKIYIENIKMNNIELEIKSKFLKVNFDLPLSNKNNESYGWENSTFIGKMVFPKEIIPIITNRSYNSKILIITVKKA